jgi:hypothetical protein
VVKFLQNYDGFIVFACQNKVNADALLRGAGRPIPDLEGIVFFPRNNLLSHVTQEK